MPENLIILGGGEHARVVMETALQMPEKWNILGYLDPKEDRESDKRFSIKHLGDDSEVRNILEKDPECKFICGIGNNQMRRKLIIKLKIPDDNWATVIHPAAEISPNAEIGNGTAIMSRAVIQTGAVVENHVIINSGAIIEHDSVIGAFSHIAPGVVTGGGVKVGKEVFVGLGARIRDHISIGKAVTVGTGSVVVTDLNDDQIVVGIPARPIAKTSGDRNIADLCISPDATLYEAMALIGKYGAAALITDKEMHLLGILNDGDIRRILFEHNDVNLPVADVMNKKFHFVRKDVPRVAALDQLKALGHRLMPVLDDNGKVVGLHLIDTMIGSLNLPNAAIIMAGGKGTRLKPLTDNLPKPMVKVAGRPILEHIILHLAGSNIRDIYISINYLGDMIEDYFKDGSTYGVRIHYIRETIPLGTAGALKLLPPLDAAAIVMNGDLVTQFDVERMLDYHKQGDYKLTIGAHDYRVDIPYGVIGWNDKQNSVTDIVEKPEEHFLVNGGIYIVEPELFELIEPDQNVPITELINRCIEKKIKVGAHLVEGDWIDVGHHKQLAAARGL